jgi:hypothetical protein
MDVVLLRGGYGVPAAEAVAPPAEIDSALWAGCLLADVGHWIRVRWCGGGIDLGVMVMYCYKGMAHFYEAEIDITLRHCLRIIG